MTANRLFLAIVPATIMLAATIAMPGVEHWLATFGRPAPSWGEHERGGLPPFRSRAGRSIRTARLPHTEAKTRGGRRRLSSGCQSVSGPQDGLVSGYTMPWASGSNARTTALIS